jgi:glycosyltransferase involved in cell wall biosynthesis
MKISIVVPVYKSEATIVELYQRIKNAVRSVSTDMELILVNDASPDGAWSQIQNLCEMDPCVKGINLSRNFGQHYAITAGLSFVSGDWCVVMDCDLQDRPEEIPALFKKAQEGFDTVLAQRIERQDDWFKKLQSRVYHRFFAYLTDTRRDENVGNFGIYHRKVIDAILSMGDSVREFSSMAFWVGFRVGFLPVQHDARKYGISSYSIRKALKLALDTILNFSDKPLRIFTCFGGILTLMSFLFACCYFSLALVGIFDVSGFASIMISLWFISGILMTMLGVIGVYLGKTFNQVKNRPVFIVADVLNVKS